MIGRTLKNIQSVWLLGLFVSVMLWPMMGQCAEKSDSAQQALDQLRILQQRLGSKDSDDDGKSGTSSGASSEEKKSGKAESKPPSRRARADARKAKSDDGDAMNAQDEAMIEELAFDGVKQQLFPLSPEQTVRVKKWYHEDEYAQATSPETPPKPTATSQFVNLSPGSTPPVIRLSQGFVSSLVFLDSTGAPWPIAAYDLGDPNAFNIQWDKVSNTLMIQASKLYTYGNLAVRLRGLNTPVMLTLIPGQKAVDYRVDLRVQGYGPNAKQMPMEASLPASANDVLLHVLDGVPPNGSTRLTVSGGDAQAWLLNNKMFVRTSLTILSPGWIGSMTSADGTHAYEMHKSPVLLVSWHGKVMQLKVEGL